jgi:hypothetical protein
MYFSRTTKRLAQRAVRQLTKASMTEETMLTAHRVRSFASRLAPSLVACAAIALAGCNGGDSSSEDSGPIPLTVPKAACGSGDKPETGLQGQVPAALRTPGGFQGFTCNLQLVGQSRGEGASWQHTWFVDKSGHKCNYYDTWSGTTNRTHAGVVTIDATNPANPTPTAYLTTTAMIDPWESLKVNERRQLLGAVNALNGNGGPELDLYDVSGDCRFPQLLSSVAVGTGNVVPDEFKAAVRGHEGSFSPDGLTYYGTNLGAGYVYPIDISNTTKPKLLTQWFTPIIQRTHGLSISEDGNRAYFTLFGQGDASRATGVDRNNGIVIADVSEVQQRKADPQIKVISTLVWGDGSGNQHTIPVFIKGKPYLINADEGGSGSGNMAGWTAACAAGLPPWNMARIIDISDETKPTIISRLQLEMNDPANCDKVIPDLAGLAGFTYGSHYCSVDNKANATTLACGYFESGIRVFDIRNPLRPKEIAYYNPAAVTTPSPGSQNNRSAANGRPDHCSAQVRLDVATASLQTTCQDNGFLALKFTNGVWPFPESSTPPGQQN